MTLARRTIQTSGSTLTRKAFILALIFNMVWINASEIFRYFVLVMPTLRTQLPYIVNVAPMNWPVFALWSLWDTILVVAATSFYGLVLERFGATIKNAVLAGLAFWLTVFGLLWLGALNMNLVTMPVLWSALPLALVEQLVAAQLVRWAMNRALARSAQQIR